MNRCIIAFLCGILFLLHLHATPLPAQTVTLNAGSNQIINWEKTRSAQLKGSVPSDTIKTAWSCPQHSDVVFKNASDPVTEAIFPRPGYYLLILSVQNTGNPIRSSTIVNVFKPRSYQERLADLVGLMTVDEKIGQLTNQSDAIPRLGLAKYDYWSEALHGLLASGATSFPQNVAMGSTWDPDLVHRVASAISDEARAVHATLGKGLTYWSPTINIARDPRWGRNEESYSEDPYLLSRMAVAFIQGMQGDDPYYLKTVSTPKHFIANNEERRRHTGSSDVDTRSLWEYYLPAFKAAVVEGKAYSVMGAYNELNHVPCNANAFLLTDLLRRDWGFEGFVVSDCGAINDMLYGHHFFKTGAEAAARSILAGCDMSCGDEYRRYLREALDAELLDEHDLDRALKRVLSARFRMGEFDPPEAVPYASIRRDALDCPAHRDLALEAARKSIVLLKNEGILPFKKGKVKSIAVIGPNAAETQLGIYSGWPNVLISPLDGIKARAAAQGIRVDYAMGCTVSEAMLKPVDARFFGKAGSSVQTGMMGEYFANMKLSGKPVLTRVDSHVDFNFGTGSPAPRMPEDRFSIRWKGTIIPPDTVRRIGTSTDDGARLYVDGRLVVDDWTEHAEKQNSAEVLLLPGRSYEIEFDMFDNGLGASARLIWDLDRGNSEAAVKAASGKDVVVLVLGTSPGIAQEELDRDEIELPQIQRNLITEVAAVNPNIVMVLINGGAVALAGTENRADAIVEAWYAGEYGGQAIAEVLFGDVNPGGKLPETFYASTRQLPPMSDYDLVNHPRTYLYLDQPVLYPFGHGLSYTQFGYRNLKMNADTVGVNGEVELQFTVQNTGAFQGDEVAQVYVRAADASIKAPVHQLKRFQRITLATGESTTLSFRIPASELSFYDTRTNDFKTEPGKWEIRVGGSSKDIRLKHTIVVE